MKRALSFAVLWALSGTGFCDQILLECGKTTGNGFNGWSVAPYTAFSEVSFDNESILLRVDQGGDYTLVLSRRIEELQKFDEVHFEIAFTELQNCTLQQVDFFASKDGETWDYISVNNDALNGTIRSGTYSFFKVSAHISFMQYGSLVCSYFRMDGASPLAVSVIEPDEPELQNVFFAFCFNGNVNVETKSEETYQLYLTNLAGQISYQASAIGSTRFEPQVSSGIYVLSIVQGNQVILTKKLIL